MKIVSGGQTGVDRAALDLAIENGIDCGGWCPAGRLDEFGRIPDRYPVLELPNAGPDQRTLQNVIDSDATVIFHFGELSGGTKYTLNCCVNHQRPHLVINAANTSVEEAAKSLTRFVTKENLNIINIAGPRCSEWPQGYAYALEALNAWLRSHDLNGGTSWSRPTN